jgi:cytochrome b561
MIPYTPATDVAARYDRTTVVLHWVTAALIVLLWLSAQVIDWFPRPGRVYVRSVHMTMGVMLAAVIVYRVTWRSLAGVRFAPGSNARLEAWARAVHLVLYLLVIAEVFLGLANAWVRGENYFNLFTIPAYDPGNKPLQQQVNAVHNLVAYIILTVAGLHAAAALFHHYVLKDHVLRRMLLLRAVRNRSTGR